MIMVNEQMARLRELENASESTIDTNEEVQNILETLTIDNEQVQRIKEDLRMQLSDIKTLQMTIEIPRNNIKNFLVSELKQNYLASLDITRYAKEYLEKTEQIEILLFRENTKLKQAICDLFTAYNQYEEALKVSELDTKIKLERKKKIGGIPKKVIQENNNDKIAKLLVEYDETKDIEDVTEQKIQRSKIKLEFKQLFETEDEAKDIFKKVTGENL